MTVRIKLSNKGFRELRTSPAMDAFILNEAQAVARRAGTGYKAHGSPGRNRARAVVTPDNLEAAIETARNPHKLIAALGGSTVERDTDLIPYTTKAGKQRMATRAQVAAWTRSRND